MIGITQETFHQFLVIAAEAYSAIVNQPNGKQVDHRLCVGAAVDIVAEIDFDAMADRPAFQVVVDALDGFDQEIGAAVNIADCIDARVRRCRDGNPGSRCGMGLDDP
jgi:hypothetical protein